MTNSTSSCSVAEWRGSIPERTSRCSTRANFIEVIENRQGLKIGCVEEVAFRCGFIDVDQLARMAEPLRQTAYGQYLLRVASE